MTPGPHFKDAFNAPHYDARFFRGRIVSSARHQILLRLLSSFSEWCQQLEIHPILMHGALLGLHLRDNLLPWEDNINLILPLDDLLKLSGTASAFDTAKYSN